MKNISKFPTKEISLMFLYFLAVANSLTIVYQYDEGNPWSKIDPLNELQTMMHLLFQPQYTNTMNFGVQTRTAGVSEEENIESHMIPTSIYIEINDKQRLPLAELPILQREELYDHYVANRFPQEQIKSKFALDVAWCGHGQVAKACNNAASSIKDSKDSWRYMQQPSLFGKSIKSIDKNERKSDSAKLLLEKRGKELEKLSLKDQQKHHRQSLKVPKNQYRK